MCHEVTEDAHKKAQSSVILHQLTSYTVQVQTSWRVRWETALGRNSCMAPDVPCFSSSNPSALAGTLNSQAAEQIPPAAAPHLLPHHHTAVKMVCLSSATAALVHHRFCPKEIKNVRTYREQGAVACFRRNPPLLSGSQLPLLWWQLFLSTSTMNPHKKKGRKDPLLTLHASTHHPPKHSLCWVLFSKEQQHSKRITIHNRRRISALYSSTYTRIGASQLAAN